MRTVPLLLTSIAVVVAVAGASYASTRVLGSGLAANCSNLALAGEFDRTTLDTCTLALEQEALGPDNAAKTYVNRGVVHMRRASLRDARDDFRQAERLMPRLPEIYVNRGVVLIKEQRWREAVAELDRGIALKPEEIEKAYYDRALAREQLDDFMGAYADYNMALKVNPDFEPARKQLTRFRPTSKR
jgi:tetratricopeptide (TPR) repeat protein